MIGGSFAETFTCGFKGASIEWLTGALFTLAFAAAVVAFALTLSRGVRAAACCPETTELWASFFAAR